MSKIKVDHAKCVGCGICVNACPMQVYELQVIGGAQKSVPVNAEKCVVCRLCESQCPQQAIEVSE